MDTRRTKIIIGNAGGTASKNSKTYKVTLPSAWIHELGINENDREMDISFDGEKIILIRHISENSDVHRMIRFCYYDRDNLCSVIHADYTARNVRIENFTDDPVKTAFGNNLSPSWDDFEQLLESRCIPRSRSGLREYLETIGLYEYDPLTIIRKTEGRMAEDGHWIKIEEETP